MSEVPSVTGTLCDIKASENTRVRYISILDRTHKPVSVEFGFPIKGSTWRVKAGLGHSVVPGMELERDGVSRRGAL